MNDQPRPVATPTFLITREYRRFTEFCDACRQYRYIGVCYGPSGVGGKTLSARRYTQWDLLEPALNPFPAAAGTPVPPEIVTCRSVLYTPSVSTSPKRIGAEMDRLCGRLSWEIELALHPEATHLFAHWRAPWTELVLVDEVDRLKLPALEELRERYDRGRIGLILIGMPGLEKRLGRYAQFYSRVGFVHDFRTLSQAELGFVLAWQWQQLGLLLDLEDENDAEAVAAVMRITSGNFRLDRAAVQPDRSGAEDQSAARGDHRGGDGAGESGDWAPLLARHQSVKEPRHQSNKVTRGNGGRRVRER